MLDQIIAFVTIMLEIMHHWRYGKDAALTYNIIVKLCITFRILPILFVIDVHSKGNSNTQKRKEIEVRAEYKKLSGHQQPADIRSSVALKSPLIRITVYLPCESESGSSD